MGKISHKVSEPYIIPVYLLGLIIKLWSSFVMNKYRNWVDYVLNLQQDYF